MVGRCVSTEALLYSGLSGRDAVSGDVRDPAAYRGQRRAKSILAARRAKAGIHGGPLNRAQVLTRHHNSAKGCSASAEHGSSTLSNEWSADHVKTAPRNRGRRDEAGSGVFGRSSPFSARWPSCWPWAGTATSPSPRLPRTAKRCAVHRRPQTAQPCRLRRALRRRRRPVAARGRGHDHRRRLPVRLAVGGAWPPWSARRSGRQLSFSSQGARSGISWRSGQGRSCRAFARDSRRMPSPICSSCGSCRSFPSGSSTLPLDCSASLSLPMSRPLFLALSREHSPLRWPVTASTASSRRSRRCTSPALPSRDREAKSRARIRSIRGRCSTPELIAGFVALGLVALIPVVLKWIRRAP